MPLVPHIDLYNIVSKMLPWLLTLCFLFERGKSFKVYPPAHQEKDRNADVERPPDESLMMESFDAKTLVLGGDVPMEVASTAAGTSEALEMMTNSNEKHYEQVISEIKGALVQIQSWGFPEYYLSMLL